MALPTPEELGEMIEKGQMTEAEAAEIMAERARRQALPFLYPPEEEPETREAPASPARRWLPLLWTLLALAGLCLVLWCC